MIYGIYTHKHIGDSIILAGAVHNVKMAHPELQFHYIGWGAGMWLHNPDVTDMQHDRLLPEIHYGSWKEERFAANGNLVEGFSKMLCAHLGIQMVPIITRTPYAVLTDREKEESKRWNGYWLLNANAQKYSVSKAYPHWQTVIDGLQGHVRIIQVGSSEKRNLTEELLGVIDYRGKSQNLRDYMTMIYGCDGIISPPSGIINIGAAFEKKAIVVAGARELAKLSDYPNMDFITNECCGYGKDEACIALTWEGKRMCINPVICHGRQYSRCMAMIPPEQIVAAVKNSLQK